MLPDMTTPVLDSLRTAIDRWTAAGEPKDEPTIWKRFSWEKALGDAEPIGDLLGGGLLSCTGTR